QHSYYNTATTTRLLQHSYYNTATTTQLLQHSNCTATRAILATVVQQPLTGSAAFYLPEKEVK
ncbi:hypothetical protein P9747_20895, partial [Paenibacillus macerans]|uniref:hypothetical protein n=1 Tax=Paenibacillus macerans TaxID=44252 RepID=UPI002E249142|nr:hypothetical protein [Paenibacillus macerans]